MPRSKIRSSAELDSVMLATLAVLTHDYNIKNADINGLLVIIKIYAAGYMDLVLTGKMPAHDIDKLCDKVGMTRQSIVESARDVFPKLAEMGVFRELDKGEIYYDFAKFAEIGKE